MRLTVFFFVLFGFFSESISVEFNSTNAHGLIYVYSSDIEEYKRRASNWVLLAEDSGQELVVALFDRGETKLGDLPNFVVRNIEPYFYAKQTDYGVLYNASNGRIVLTGSGKEIENVLRFRTIRSVSSDVDESTWGKIKELFQ